MQNGTLVPGDLIEATCSTTALAMGNILEIVEFVEPFFVRAVDISGVEHMLLPDDWQVFVDEDDDL